MARYTNEPLYSCPSFDEAIKHIEVARDINEQLREDNRRLERELDDAKDQINQLKEQIDGMEVRDD